VNTVRGTRRVIERGPVTHVHLSNMYQGLFLCRVQARSIHHFGEGRLIWRLNPWMLLTGNVLI
jgi:hypothetical protein